MEDGTILKVKVVVRKIMRSPTMQQGYPVSVVLDTMNAVAAIVPPGLKGQPSSEPFDPSRDVRVELKFEEQDVKQQEYITNDGYRILVKPVVTNIFRYKKYNVFGEPIYSATIQQITKIERIATTG
ncbi:MAG: hypothetical protein ACP5QE_08230 [Conexivisphaera sp.]